MTSARSDDQGLRILLAHDLSETADQAVGLIAEAAWPDSTVVRVVTSPIGVGPVLPSFANLRDARDQARQVRGTIAHAHDRVTAELDQAGLIVETALVHGKPQRAIVAEADRFAADLVVVGARGQRSIAATVLGSVSRAVVESSARSVLVARGKAGRRVLLATDGSAPAALATSIVGTWPMFASATILLVAVGGPAPRYPRAVLSQSEWRSAFRDTIGAAADQACDAAEQAVAGLAEGDREVDVEIRVGDVGHEIAAAAGAWPADIVVLGAHSRPLLQRVFLGSVARTVLDGVAASVLVARAPSGGEPVAG